jgi:hypothetical protein
MAADTARFDGQGRYRTGSVQKILRMDHGGLFAAAGVVTAAHAAFELLRAWMPGAKLEPLSERDRDFGGVMLLPGGDVYRVWHDLTPIRATEGFVAEGYAEEMAIGAMEAGATAEEAVRICIRRSSGCGGDVQVERLDGGGPGGVVEVIPDGIFKWREVVDWVHSYGVPVDPGQWVEVGGQLQDGQASAPPGEKIEVGPGVRGKLWSSPEHALEAYLKGQAAAASDPDLRGAVESVDVDKIEARASEYRRGVAERGE